MDRIREARRGNMAAVNGGLARRRQRSSSLRDSPDEDGGMEMQETVRLRDRASKKDRDRDRSGRNKRRRGDRMMHGSHREEGDDSSEESMDEDDDDEEDESTVSVPVRLPPPSAPNPAPVAPVIQNHHLRKGFPVKSARAPGTGTWKVVEEMIGASIPRKARSSSVKRSQECWLSGGGGAAGGGGGDMVHRQASMSPARPSPTSTTPVSPSSSNVSVRKKVQKPISGSKQRLSKSSKTSSIQEIEIEVAEVLFGMTRHVPLKQEEQKHDLKESNGSGAEVKSRLSSPYPISSPIATSQAARPSNPISNSAPPTAIAPKRKLPRKRFEDESPTSPPPNSAPVLPATSNSSAAKMDVEPALPPVQKTDTSPRSEKKSLVVESSVSSDPAVSTTSSAVKMHQDASKSENMMAKEEAICQQKESTSPNLDVKIEEVYASKAVVISESQREDKFSFDLMALPGRSSPEMENSSDYVAECKSVEMELAPKPELSKGEELEKTEKKSKTESDEILNNGCKVEESDNLKKQSSKERNLDLLLDLEKIDKDVSGSNKNQQTLKHQSRAPQKIEKTGLPTSSSTSPMTMQIPGWPGGFPPFGYMGPVPSLPPVVPLDGSSTSSKTVQSFLPSSQLRPKRCAAHCYIAQNIHYHQQITRLNPFWPSAAGAAPMYAAKQYNLNTAPPSDAAIIAGALPGSVPGRSMGSVQEKSAHVSAAHSGHSSKDKNCASSAQFVDAASLRKVPAAAAMQQSAQPGSAGNMLAPAAFIFPMHQQQAPAVVQAATVGAANRSGVVAKLSQGSGNAAPPSTMAAAAAAASGANGPGTTMNFNYPGLPPNEQYLAFLQNGTYSFPIPAHVGGAPSYRAANSGQTLPYFNLSFYSPGMIHPSQLRMQQPPPPSQAPPPYSQQGHQNPSTSSGSSSSQKNTQQSQRVPAAAGSTAAAANSHGFPSKQQQLQQQQLLHQARQIEPEPVSEDAPSTADSRVSQAPKGMYAQKFSIPAHSQNFALIAPAATALSGGGGGHGEKQQQAQNQMMKMDLTPSQAFAMSFASFGGAAGASTGAPPHGFDFSSMSQNHALFQSLPEPTRQGYQISAAAHSAQQRHSNGKKVEERKPSPDLGNTNAPNEEVKSSPANKPMINSQQQQSLTFTRADTEPPMSSIINNSMMDGSSRTLNLIQQPPNGAPRISNRPASTPASNPMTAAAHGSNSPHVLSQQHQQQVLQLQKQHQQLQMQQQLQQQQQQRAKPVASHTSANMYSDRLPGNSAAASKYAQGLAGFPPALTQSSASAQSAQWKTASRTTNPPSSAASPAVAVPPPSSSSSKNQMPLQQQVRGQQPLAAHQPHQISFGVSPGKAAGQLGPASNVGSPQNSVSKSSGGSPHSSSTIPKSAPPPSAVLPVLPFQKQQQQQQQGKNSSSSSNSSLPVVNRNMPSILGNPHNTSPTTPQHMSSKQLPSSQHLQQSQMSKQHFPQAQFFFSNPYMQTQNSQSDMVAAAAAGYFQQHHRRQSDQPQSQARQNSLPATTGMLSLGPSSSSLSLTGGGGPAPDQSKGAAAAAAAAQAMNNNSKSLTPAGLIQQHQAQFAAASQPGSGAASAGHPMMPYIHAMQSVPLKPDVSASGEQKPAAGR